MIDFKANFESLWTVDELLLDLGEFQRVDDGVDLSAFTLAGMIRNRNVYVYLYGPKVDTICYDLEDWSLDTGEADHALERGEVDSPQELLKLCRYWLSAADCHVTRNVLKRYGAT
jgi:hypothetical protein